MNRIDEIIKLSSKVNEITDDVQKKLDSMFMTSNKFVFSVSLTESKDFKVKIYDKAVQQCSIELDSVEARRLNKFLNSLFDEEKKVFKTK